MASSDVNFVSGFVNISSEVLEFRYEYRRTDTSVCKHVYLTRIAQRTHNDNNKNAFHLGPTSSYLLNGKTFFYVKLIFEATVPARILSRYKPTSWNLTLHKRVKLQISTIILSELPFS